jgi:hypothetical protein
MSRGIQKGTVAWDTESLALDKGLKDVAKSLFPVLLKKYGPDLSFRLKLTKPEIPGGVGACAPDGGAWYWKGVLVAVFEGKKQGRQGNAIERWYKNNYICRRVNSDVNYVTFASGAGAAKNEVIWKTLHVAHDGEFNTFRPGANTCYMSVSGYTHKEIADRMIQAIEGGIDGTVVHVGRRKK